MFQILFQDFPLNISYTTTDLVLSKQAQHIAFCLIVIFVSYNLKIRKVVIIGSQCLALKQGSPRLLFTTPPSRTSALVKSIKIFNSISLLKI